MFAMTEKNSQLNVALEKQSSVTTTNAQCYEELTEACKQIAAEKNVTLASVMHIQALKTMSEKLPMTEAEMLEIPYVTKAKFDKYGKPLLEITTKYSCMLAMDDVATTSSNQPSTSMFDDDFFSESSSSDRRKSTSRSRGRKRKGYGRGRNINKR